MGCRFNRGYYSQLVENTNIIQEHNIIARCSSHQSSDKNKPACGRKRKSGPSHTTSTLEVFSLGQSPVQGVSWVESDSTASGGHDNNSTNMLQTNKTAKTTTNTNDNDNLNNVNNTNKNGVRRDGQDSENSMLLTEDLSIEFTETDLMQVLTLFLDTEQKSNIIKNPQLNSAPDSSNLLSIVYNSAPVDITLAAYVNRVVTYSQCEESTYITALIYLQKVKEYHGELAVCELNVHRLFITSVVVAAKYIQDNLFPMSYYAKCGGVPSPSEMDRLEIAFLEFIHFDLFVSETEYKKMSTFLKGFLNDEHNLRVSTDSMSEITFAHDY